MSKSNYSDSDPLPGEKDVGDASPPSRSRRMLDINSDNGDDCGPMDTGTKAAAASPRTLTSISVLTWNVWFGKLQRIERYNYILSRIIVLSPDVACFQEVTSPFLKALKSNSEIERLYYVSNNPISSYGILSIVKKDIAAEIAFHEEALPSSMGRSLLVAKIPVKSKDGDDAKTYFVQIGNVHLESLTNELQRRQQLAVSSQYLTRDHESQPTAAMLVGDFNFDSSQNWGDWDLQWGKCRPKEELENRMLAEVMPEWIDAWPYMKGDDDPGITFDGATNPCVRKEKEMMRYDRVMLRMNSEKPRLEPQSIEMVGTKAINETGLKASDHYGLFIKANIIV